MKEANLKHKKPIVAESTLSRAELHRMQSSSVVTSVTLEEWDCPEPGVKHMPKYVKQNIKQNQKELRYYYKKQGSADSLRASR